MKWHLKLGMRHLPIYFISFTVADQDAPRQLSRIHDVDGTYYCAKSDTFVGNVFVSQEGFASWFKFVQDFVGTERAPTPEGSSHGNLEELTSQFTHDKSPPIAGPSSSATHLTSPTPPHLLIPPIATDSPVAQASHNSEEDEDKVLDQLAGEYN